MSRFEFSEVKRVARGGWAGILPALGIPSEFLRAKHGPCPGCGGRDRFRFDDKNGDGTWICGGAGEIASGDGFSLLCHVHGWDKSRSLKETARQLGLAATITPEVAREHKRKVVAVDDARVLQHELMVLIQVLNARLSSAQLTSNHSFRNARPEWVPYPDEHWERELLAARRIRAALESVYGP